MWNSARFTILACLIIVTSCSSIQSEKAKMNSEVIKSALSVFNKTKDQSKVFAILKKLKKESDGFYMYEVKTWSENQETITIRVTATQLKDYFGSYNQALKKLDALCLKDVDPNHPQINQYNNLESCYKAMSEEKGRGYGEENVELESFLPSKNKIWVEGKLLFGFETVLVTVSGANDVECNGKSEFVSNPFLEHLRCYSINKAKEYLDKAALEYKKKDEENKLGLEKELAFTEASAKDGTGAKVYLCQIEMKIDAIDDELNNQKEVSKRTGLVSYGRIQLLTGDRVRLEKMLAEMRAGLIKDGKKIATTPCKELYKR